jgi:hypothetical protein
MLVDSFAATARCKSNAILVAPGIYCLLEKGVWDPGKATVFASTSFLQRALADGAPTSPARWFGDVVFG